LEVVSSHIRSRGLASPVKTDRVRIARLSVSPLLGLAAWLVLALVGHPWLALVGATWWALVVVMLDWHLGMLELRRR